MPTAFDAEDGLQNGPWAIARHCPYILRIFC